MPKHDDDSVTPWEVLSSRHLFEDELVRHRIDTCRTAAGSVIERYHVLEMPDWANIVALTPERDIVLVEQYRHAAVQTLLELPGGCVEATDDSPGAAAERELLEETGYAVTELIELRETHPNPALQTNRAYSFLGVGAHIVASPKPDPGEELAVRTMPLAQYLDLVYTGGAPIQSMHLATIHLALRRLDEPR